MKKYPLGRGNHVVRKWKEGGDKEYASGGYKSLFHEANLFFSKNLIQIRTSNLHLVGGTTLVLLKLQRAFMMITNKR